MELNKSCSEHDDIYIFKVRDYTTELVGRRNEKEGFFYIQRGDGNIFRYDDYRITFSEKIKSGRKDDPPIEDDDDPNQPWNFRK